MESESVDAFLVFTINVFDSDLDTRREIQDSGIYFISHAYLLQSRLLTVAKSFRHADDFLGH